MPTNPLEQSIGYATRMTAAMGRLYDRAGNSQHPNGLILSQYRLARRAMEMALSTGGSAAALDVLNAFSQAVKAELSELMFDAEDLGKQYFTQQAEAYGVIATASPKQIALPAYQAVAARVDQQAAAVNAMILSGADEALILGDGERLGVLQPAPVVRDAAMWIVETAMQTFLSQGDGTITPSGRKVLFDKQAVAGLDENTTDCCLQVHGQIQPLDGKFHLTGTPRFADELEHTPFHWHCRTSIVLYLRAYDDGLTVRMRQGADTIIAERAAGGSGYRHPADAFA